MRVVFDTNTVISALLFRGYSSWLVEHWQREDITPLLNHQTAHELLRVLAYPKFGLTPDQANLAAARYLLHAERVGHVESASHLPDCRDPDDRMFLRLCDTGRADVLVTGDKDLLELRGRTPFTIETLAEYLSRFE